MKALTRPHAASRLNVRLLPVWSSSTKDGVPPRRVPAEGEDVGVVSCDHGEGVRLSGQLRCSLDGSVEHHRFRQCKLCYAVMVAVIDSPSCKSRAEHT